MSAFWLKRPVARRQWLAMALILFLSPSLVVLMSAFWLKRPVARQWLAMALSYAGVVLVFAHDLSFGGAARCC